MSWFWDVLGAMFGVGLGLAIALAAAWRAGLLGGDDD